ncbi:uncharacterized protein [Ptychodera flava]|uniref:uncharacterized protein n=1 Tax=Ptychodera flava TaxID=63121 RepID=UPI003969C13A
MQSTKLHRGLALIFILASILLYGYNKGPELFHREKIGNSNRNRLFRIDGNQITTTDEDTLLSKGGDSKTTVTGISTSSAAKTSENNFATSHGKPNRDGQHQHFPNEDNKQIITESHLKIANQTVSTGTKSTSRILSLSKDIAETYGFVTLQFLNRGYLNITKSWICNVKCMGVLPKVLFIATDQNALDGLSKFHPKAQVVLLPFQTMFKLSFGFVTYYQFILLRTWIILILLQRDIPLTLIESDAVWFDDVLPTIESLSGYDLVSMSNTVTETGISGGFLYLNTTQTAKMVWLDVFQQFQGYMDTRGDGSENMGAAHSEKKILERVLHKTTVKVKTLPLENFVSGIWYKNDTLREMTKPKVIQINYIVGVDRKIRNAKHWGHWFLTDEGDCKENNEIMKCQ